MPHLSILVLGPLQVSVDGVPVDGFATDKVRALLAYLALSPGHPHRREALAGLLWPEFPERSARASLRNALANLRSVLGEHANSGAHNSLPPLLHSTRQTIQFNGQSDYWLDAEAFEELAAAVPLTSEGLEQAVNLVRGLFLEGFTLADAAPFEEWLLLRREHSGRRLVEALDSLSAIYEGNGAYEQALAHARSRVQLEPWQEDGQQQLMRLLALSGQQGAALAQYETYRRLLVTELGVEPSEQIQAAYELLLKGELPPGPPAELRAFERQPQVAGECPYRGLAAFREVDAPFFFGREGFAEHLFQALDDRALVAVIVGSSGSGKSSAVFAGLLPRLREEGDWLIAGFRPGGEPFQALAAALIALLEPKLGETDRLIETHKLAKE
jgi:DNA-binding SARP family transcriptional activator